MSSTTTTSLCIAVAIGAATIGVLKYYSPQTAERIRNLASTIFGRERYTEADIDRTPYLYDLIDQSTRDEILRHSRTNHSSPELRDNLDSLSVGELQAQQNRQAMNSMENHPLFRDLSVKSFFEKMGNEQGKTWKQAMVSHLNSRA